MGVLAIVSALLACANDDDDPSREEATSSAIDATSSTGDSADSTEALPDTDDEGLWNSLDDRPCIDDSFLTYESFGGPFMLNNCTGCHHSRLPADQRQGAPIEVNFDDIDDIRTHADRIWARAADSNDSMPPVGAPPMSERTRLGEWLACGAPTDADLEM